MPDARRQLISPAIAAMAGTLAMAGGWAGPASASMQPADPFASPLRPVTPGVADIDALARDLRLLPADLRAPLGFERVYDLGDGRFARIDGGLVAIFDQSTYAPGDAGTHPTIPPGTTFHVGVPDDLRARLEAPPTWRPTPASNRATSLAGPAARPVSLDAASLFVGPSRRATPDPAPAHRPSPPAASMFTSEAERIRVVARLLERARQAAASP